MVYTFPRRWLPESDEPVQIHLDALEERYGGNSLHSEESSLHNGETDLHKRFGTRNEALSQNIFSLLKGKKRAPPDLIRRTILIICKDDFATVDEIAAIISRSHDTVSIHYISMMVKESLPELKYPKNITPPHQSIPDAEVTYSFIN